MAAPRPVRIARRRGDAPPPTAPSPSDPGRTSPDASAGPAFGYERNRGGTARAVRLYLVFAAGLVGILVLFVGLAASSPSPGVSHSTLVYAWLVGLTVALAAGGALITILRAPRGARFGPEGVVVTDRLGRTRRWPTAPQLNTRVVQRYSPGWLGPDATELVELSDGTGHRAQYLVARGFFDRADGPS